MMRKLYRFFWNCNRNEDLEGLFIAEDRRVDQAIGKDLYFGEVLDKHSEVYGPLGAEDLEVKSEDQNFIATLAQVMFGRADAQGTISGYSPLEYMEEELDKE